MYCPVWNGAYKRCLAANRGKKITHEVMGANLCSCFYIVFYHMSDALYQCVKYIVK